MLKYTVIAVALAGVCSTAASAQTRQEAARPYTVSFKPERGVYCIRFFSDTLNDPRPNTQAPTCLTKARWAQQRVFIQHRLPTAEIATR